MGEQHAAMLPITEMQRDEERAATAAPRGVDDFQLALGGDPIANDFTAFNAPQINQFRGEILVRGARGFFRR